MPEIKVTPEQAVQMREMYQRRGPGGAGYHTLAARFSVSTSTVHRVMSGAHPSAAGLPDLTGGGRRKFIVNRGTPAALTTRQVRMIAASATRIADTGARRCPTCHARPYEKCLSLRAAGVRPMKGFHPARRAGQ